MNFQLIPHKYTLSGMISTFISTVLLIVGIYAAYCCVLFLLQRKVLFPTYLIEVPPEPDFDAHKIEPHWLEISSARVEAWYIPPASKNSAKTPVIIFAHGNGELIDFWPQALAPFGRMGFGLLLIEYPGYGRSGGSPSQKDIRETFLKGYDMIIKRPDVDPQRIVLFGRSLGGGAVCDLAARRPSAAMILISTFTGTRPFARQYLVPSCLVRDPFDNLAVVRSYSRPLLVIHGRHDEIIPYAHGVRLAEAAPDARLVTYRAGHNDCPPDWRVFWKDVTDFLRSHRL